MSKNKNEQEAGSKNASTSPIPDDKKNNDVSKTDQSLKKEKNDASQKDAPLTKRKVKKKIWDYKVKPSFAYTLIIIVIFGAIYCLFDRSATKEALQKVTTDVVSAHSKINAVDKKVDELKASTETVIGELNVKIDANTTTLGTIAAEVIKVVNDTSDVKDDVGRIDKQQLININAIGQNKANIARNASDIVDNKASINKNDKRIAKVDAKVNRVATRAKINSDNLELLRKGQCDAKLVFKDKRFCKLEDGTYQWKTIK
jgi:tetrahydromethanopterin S-methyltransferase subunit G